MFVKAPGSLVIQYPGLVYIAGTGHVDNVHATVFADGNMRQGREVAFKVDPPLRVQEGEAYRVAINLEDLSARLDRADT